MVSYIKTGQQYSKPKKRPIRPPPLPPLPPRDSRPGLQPRGYQQRYYETRSEAKRDVSLNDTKYLENLPSFVFDYDNGPPPPLNANDTKYLENMPSFDFDDDQAPITTNETKFLENMKSFVFDNDEGRSQRRLALTDGVEPGFRSKPDP